MSGIETKILNRFEELIQMGERVIESQYSRSGGGIIYMGDRGVDYELAHQWGTSCLNLLSRVFGEDSVHYQQFETKFPEFHDLSPVKKALGILKAAKEDYELDFLFNTRTLIEAEVFEEFLEQAEHLLEMGYYQPAAVIAGSVLEDGLRKLCVRTRISISERPALNRMNADLAKSGAYNKLMQKRITMLADVRNKAAHGRWDEFTSGDVEDMLRSVRMFMESQFQ